MTEKAKLILELWRTGKSQYQIGKILGYKGKVGYISWVIKRYGNVPIAAPAVNTPVAVELFLSDAHFPHCDAGALSVAMDFARDVKVDTIVLGGDLVDFHSVSFFSRDPNQRDMQSERETVLDFLSVVRNAFPVAKIYYMKGNHEHRLQRYIQTNAPELGNLNELEVKELLKLDQEKITYVDNEEIMRTTGQPFKIEHLFHLHGHEIKSSFNAVNVARILFQKAMMNVIFGHFHVSQEWIQRKINGDVAGAWSVGCLCDLVADYAMVNNWNHGFAIVKYKKSGDFTVRNHKIIDGDVL